MYRRKQRAALKSQGHDHSIASFGYRNMRLPLPLLGVTLALSSLTMPFSALASSHAPGGVAPTPPELIKTGLINGADRSHRANGRAEIVRRDDGSLVLYLRDFRVTNGPALRVLLTKHSNPRQSRDVEGEEYIDLGALRSNRGDQEYAIPGDVDLVQINSVVVYCEPYSVVFAVARLEEAS